MRIAIVGNFGLAGKQTMAVRALPIAEFLAAREHAVLMALPVRCAEDLSGPVERGGVRIRYAAKGPRVPGISHLWQALLLWWHCRQWQPEVVYCFKPIAYSGCVLAVYWWLRRLGLYRGLIALDTDDWEGEGGWNERQPFPRWLKAIVAREERWALRHADVTTVASRALLELAEQAGVRRAIYIPNAVSASSPGLLPPRQADLRAKLGIAARPTVLLYTRFVEFRVGRVLDVLEGIVSKLNETTLLVVGEGLEGEDEELARLAADRGLRDNVLFAGWVRPEELPGYFQAADVAIYPLDDTLLNRSKCPMKLLDLLAAGVPVVADRVGQAAEYVVDGRTGLLVDPGEHRCMVDAVVSLLGSPERRHALGEAARADARARWSWEVWAPKVEAAITGQLWPLLREAG